MSGKSIRGGSPLNTTTTENLGAAKRAKLNEINAATDVALNSLKFGLSDGEVRSWDTQVREAERWLADNGASVPLLDAMVAKRGDTIADLVAKVMEKAALYSLVSGDIIGQCQACEKLISDATDVAEVEAIDTQITKLGA